MRRFFSLLPLLIILTACNLPASPTPDDPFEIATQIALTGEATPLRTQPTLATAPQTPAQSTSDAATPRGKIAYVCQIFKVQVGDQICIINADGTGQHRLTTENYTRHFYPSLAPDGQSVVYSEFASDNIFDIYEIDLSGKKTQLTDGIGVLTAPEISPDGTQIVFTHWTPSTDHAVWIMNRDGSNPREVTDRGWDPTWSPNGREILFASERGGTVQMYIISLDSGITRQVHAMERLRGRTDWSIDGQIVTYAGASWNRELFLMNADGSNLHQITPSGGNSQGPSFSPDGEWVTFTAYFDQYGDIHGCEIYIMRTDGSDLRRLTENDYCDWQPRWGL